VIFLSFSFSCVTLGKENKKHLLFFSIENDVELPVTHQFAARPVFPEHVSFAQIGTLVSVAQ